MTSKLVVNTIEADTGISSVSFASSISMSSTSVFHFSDAGVNIGADTNISRLGNGILGFNINGAEKARIDSSGHIKVVGVVTATHFYGSGANLTGLPAGTTINNNAANRIITGEGGTTLNGEANLTFDGTSLNLPNVNSYIKGGGHNIVQVDAIKTYLYGGTGGIQFRTADNSAELINITNDGKLFLGATSSGHTNRTFISSRNSGNYLSIITDANDACGITFGDSTSGTGNYETYIQHNNVNNNFIIHTAQGVKQFAFKSDGDLSISDGNLVIGTSGHGIDFSSNTENESGAGSNYGQILDDYEEGSWTPVWDAPNQSSTTFGLNHQYGYYTKIGNLVHVTCYLQGFTHTNDGGGANDDLSITGLPFTVAYLPGGGNDRHAASFAVGSRYRMLVDDLILNAYAGSTEVRLFEHTSGNGMVRVKTNQITPRSGTNECYFAGSYRIHA